LQQVADLLAKQGITVSYQAIGTWERGETEPSRDKVYALERALKVKAGQLSAPLGYVMPGRKATEADYNSRISKMPPRVRDIIDDIIDGEERRRR
jgi:transcriptional regulator with XRE-family HTH domain